MRHGNRHRGAVLLMVIGLLTVVAMLGSMLLLMARLDSQTSQAIAAAAPEDQVAQGILDRILSDRRDDLHIGATGPYGNLNPADPLAAERQMVDYPHENYDQALACIELYDPGTGAVWRHVSHLPGTTLIGGPPDNVAPASAADTDGDGIGDALLFRTGTFDSNGNEFCAAVRMIDASGLVNVNVADATRPAAPTQVMLPSDIVLGGVLSSAGAVVNERHPVTGNGPYDMADMLAVAWLHTAPLPDTDNGRLSVAAAGGGFLGARNSLTSESTSTVRSPLYRYLIDRAMMPGTTDPNKVAVPAASPAIALDPVPVGNLAARQACYDAFLAMLQAYDYDGTPGATANRIRAAQLTVNLIDYLDPNETGTTESYPTRLDARDLDTNFPANSYVYGIERHPYVSKVFRKLTFVDPGPPPVINETAAIELINPYAEDLDLSNYRINGTSLAGKTITAAGPAPAGRFVIFTPGPIKIDPGLPLTSQEVAGLSTKDPVIITWEHPVDHWVIQIDETEGIALTDPNAAEPNHWNAKFRDDALDHGRYTRLRYAQGLSEQDVAVDYTDPAGPTMGQANPAAYLPSALGDAAPVYVRNDGLISLGDLMRLFLVGPGEVLGGQSFTKALDDNLKAGVPHQLLPSGDVPATAFVHLPVGCTAGEFFNLLRPQTAGGNRFHAGLVNVNTASAAVLKSLPGIAALGTPAERDAMADEIIAYRDQGIIGGRNYSNRAAAGATGIANLRNQPGFATASEVAIPLRKAMEVNSISLGIGTSPPWNYKVADAFPYTEDGLPTSGAEAVRDDPVKQNVLYSWASNQVTVRSNVFLVYIRVQRDADPTSQSRRYVALIDRSNCQTTADRPRVLMFTELR